MQIKKRSLSIIAIVCAIYAALNPFDFTATQVILSTALIAGISLWATGFAYYGNISTFSWDNKDRPC